jgi:hypothetical protein
MSHSTHEEKPLISSKAAMMFALIIVGLILGTMNFVKAMSHSEEGHGGGHGTEASHGAAGHEGAAHEATSHEATGHEATHDTAAAHAAETHEAKDSTHHEAAAEHHEAAAKH